MARPMARGKVKADHRADNRGGPWAGLPHVVIDSLAYRHLSLWARAILIELVREMNGYNNGEIGLSQRQIGERIGTSNYRRIGPAIAELMEHGLIDVTVEGKWKQRLARQYRLTFINTGKPGHYKAATNEYRDWRPGVKSGVATVSAKTVNPADPVATEAQSSADPVATRRNGKLPKTSFTSADTVASLISKPYPGTETPEQSTEANGSKIAGGPIAARAGGLS